LGIYRQRRIAQKIKAIIDNADNDLYVSIVSAWEIAIKRSLHRNKTTLCSVDEFLDEVEASGFHLITLQPHHVRLIESMPYHHRDPFDRMLIATAMAENMVFLTADENAVKYNVKCLW